MLYSWATFAFQTRRIIAEIVQLLSSTNCDFLSLVSGRVGPSLAGDGGGDVKVSQNEILFGNRNCLSAWGGGHQQEFPLKKAPWAGGAEDIRFTTRDRVSPRNLLLHFFLGAAVYRGKRREEGGGLIEFTAPTPFYAKKVLLPSPLLFLFLPCTV